ncbi:MAG: 30S ribosomal protein S8e [Nanoarchaeota archaeon]
MKYGRKITGGKYHKFRKKKKFSLQGTHNKVKLRETKKKIVRTRGGYKKTILLSIDYVNVIDPKTGKTKKVKIKNVLETPANKFLARQNILVKSAIIDTEIGKVKITNRPSREGMINAVLME